MDSLEDLSAKQLIQNYPLPLVEKIVKYGSERIKKENEREVIIKFAPITDITKEKLLDYCHFFIDMKINEIIYNVKSSDLKIQAILKMMESIDTMSKTDMEMNFMFNLNTMERSLKYEESKQLIELLREYPQYRKYFIFAKCYKGDYIGILFDYVGMYGGHVIEDNFNNLMFGSNNFRILYQVDW